MKYGQQFENESVPEWSLHNLDYNALKHEIKAHTTRDQATALAIPGHQDSALQRFEDDLYYELQCQHDRLHLFVTSKADEISRRLDHLAGNIQRWITKSSDPKTPSRSIKQHRKYLKHERELLQCQYEIQALSRFSSAQVVALRKILKKYRKWTGSKTLGSRFNEEVLSNPKSFTKQDFSHLQTRYEDVCKILNEASPKMSEPGSPSSDEQPFPGRSPSSRSRDVAFALPEPTMPPVIKYWNEYDNGSECGGGDDDGYAIYVNPDEEMSFPGLEYAQRVFHGSMSKAKGWLRRNKSPVRRPLLAGNRTISNYSSTAINSESEEDGYTSSDGFPVEGYNTLYALPSVGNQELARYREKVCFRGTIGFFVISFILLGIASILISTGKQKLRVEVNAGVTVSVVASLFFACSGLGMTMYRRDPLSVLHRLTVWCAFTASCILNGMLLILVVGNTP